MHDDPAGERFHAAYFSQHPDVWTHGDLIEITERGTARMHGRSDGTMNVHGIRIGPAELYRVLASFAEITEAMVVEQPTPGNTGDSRMVLLVVTAPGHPFDPPLRARIRTALAREASPAHVPAVIVDVPELPMTHSGKSSEVAATEALRARESANISALRNPGCLRTIADRVADHDAAAARALARRPGGRRRAGAVADLGGCAGRPGRPGRRLLRMRWHLALTAPLFQQIADRLGRRLPLSTILHAPTISSLAALLGDDLDHGWGTLELLRGGTSHDRCSSHLGCSATRCCCGPWQSASTRPGRVRPAGARSDGRRTPAETVEEMATEQIDGIRSLQPHGPYALLGYSLGGAVVVEIARRLLRDGEQVEFLGVVDTHSSWGCLDARGVAAQALRLPLRWPRAFTADLPRTLRHVQRRIGLAPVAAGDPQAARIQAAGRRAVDAYRPLAYPGSIVYFRASIPSLLQVDATAIWRPAAAALRVERVPGHHDELVRLHAADLAARRDPASAIRPLTGAILRAGQTASSECSPAPVAVRRSRSMRWAMPWRSSSATSCLGCEVAGAPGAKGQPPRAAGRSRRRLRMPS